MAGEGTSGTREPERGRRLWEREAVHFQEQEGRGQKAKEGLVALSCGNRDFGRREDETKGDVSETVNWILSLSVLRGKKSLLKIASLVFGSDFKHVTVLLDQATWATFLRAWKPGSVFPLRIAMPQRYQLFPGSGSWTNARLQFPGTGPEQALPEPGSSPLVPPSHSYIFL